MEFYRGDLQIGHPTFAEGSQAVTQPAGAPAEISAPKIVYSKMMMLLTNFTGAQVRTT